MTAWNQASKEYRFAQFASARTRITPLIATGFALDDPVLRIAFRRDVAAIYCMSGLTAQATAYGARSIDELVTPSEQETFGPYDRGIGVNPLLMEIYTIGGGGRGFYFRTPDEGDFINVYGTLVDQNSNGRLDDRATLVDLGSGVMQPDSVGYGTVPDLNVNGATDSGCGVEARRPSLVLAALKRRVRASSRGEFSVRLRCRSDVGCRIAIKVSRTTTGASLVTKRSSTVYLAPRSQRTVILRLSTQGRKLLSSSPAGLRAYVTATLNGAPKPSGTDVVTLTR